jgi:hypothetical protein
VNGTANVATGSDVNNSTSGALQIPSTACLDVSSALDVSAGANADLFKIISKSDSVTLFSKSFDLFNVRDFPYQGESLS